APINIQVEGRDMNEQYRIAREVKELIEREVPGAVDVRIQQTIDYPTIRLEPDRTKMAYSGISHEDTVKNLMSVLNSSTSFDPAFWLDSKTGNHFFVGVTYQGAGHQLVGVASDGPRDGDQERQRHIQSGPASGPGGRAEDDYLCRRSEPRCPHSRDRHLRE